MADNSQNTIPQTLLEACIGLHEMFSSLLQAGFTESQALQVIGHMMAANPPQD